MTEDDKSILRQYFPNESIMDDIIKNRYGYDKEFSDEEISKMIEELLLNNSASELMESYLTWNGIIGYTGQLKEVSSHLIRFSVAKKLLERGINPDEYSDLTELPITDLIFNLIESNKEQRETISSLRDSLSEYRS
jgi:hypothetical protein